MRPAVGLFIFVHKGMDATLAIKMRGWNRGMNSKKEVQHVYLVGAAVIIGTKIWR